MGAQTGSLMGRKANEDLPTTTREDCPKNITSSRCLCKAGIFDVWRSQNGELCEFRRWFLVCPLQLIVDFWPVKVLMVAVLTFRNTVADTFIANISALVDPSALPSTWLSSVRHLLIWRRIYGVKGGIFVG